MATVDAHKGERLAAPAFLACNLAEDSDEAPGGEILYTDWNDVEDADKYSVDLEARDDADGDDSFDRTEEFAVGTSDRVDGRPMGASDLDIPLSELTILVDTDGDGEADEEIASSEATAKVKGLNPPEGAQDSPSSEAFSCTL